MTNGTGTGLTVRAADAADEGALVPVPERPRGILALDIDGTLLGPAGKLGERTRRAVHAAGEAGWLVTLATGRRWGSTKPIADRLGLRVPLIVFNGALARDSVSGAILHYNPLPRSAVAPLVRALVARGLQPVVYEDVQAGERLLTGPAERDNDLIGEWLAGVSEEYGPIVARLPYEELAEVGGAVRIVAYDTVERMRGLEALAEGVGLEYRTLLYPVGRRNATMAELLHPHGTKAVALAALAGRYGLTLAETVAVGDGHNDVEMLAEAGLGVAMGQAPPEVREHAALTIGGHADDGLADFIERELLVSEGFPHHLVSAKRGKRGAE
ncbi:MAG: HAD hydrolase family protein [Chloroflexota bacterium]|nr:HAD hydrolase family protein [Chloroflexota bacterium]